MFLLPLLATKVLQGLRFQEVDQELSHLHPDVPCGASARARTPSGTVNTLHKNNWAFEGLEDLAELYLRGRSGQTDSAARPADAS